MDNVPPGAAREPVTGPHGGVAARAVGGYPAFEQGCPLDDEIASAALAVVVDELAGPDRHPATASDDAVLGMLSGFDKLVSWAEAGRLGLVREMIRRRPQPGYEGSGPAGLPGACQDGLTQEVSAELAISASAADKLITTAYELARLPETAAALEAGVISGYKASLIAAATGPLDDEHAAEADRRAAPKLAGKTPGQIKDLIRRTVIAVDPEGARRRREEAQREQGRVEFWQDEINGTANLAGFGLPTDEALIANQRIQDRAVAYKRARVLPGAAMDLLRVRAYIDLLLGRDARDTILADSAADGAPDGAPTADRPPDSAAPDSPGTGENQDDAPAGDAPAGSGTGTGAGLASNVNLTVPMSTLLGLADRPGHLAGLGAIDPALARTMATAAAGSGRSAWCVTVTNDQGHAIGHGCARPAPGKPGTWKKPGTGSGPGTRDGPAFTQRDDQGPPDGYGTWALTLADGQELIVKLGPIPVTDCDHRYESARYRPSGLLRHLVQVRDGTCTFPPCRRPARNCDFEHATPYHLGGRTDLCNCGPRCRARPPGQAKPRLVGHPGPARLPPMAHPSRPPLHQRTRRTPGLTTRDHGQYSSPVTSACP